MVGSNVIWSPVKDLDIGLEGIYEAIRIDKGRVVDTNKNLPIGAINNVTRKIVPLGTPGSTVIFKSSQGRRSLSWPAFAFSAISERRICLNFEGPQTPPGPLFFEVVGRKAAD